MGEDHSLRFVSQVSEISGKWVSVYLDVAKSLSDRGSEQHRCSRYDRGGEENGSQLPLIEIKLLLEEVSHPGSKHVSICFDCRSKNNTYKGASPEANESKANNIQRLITIS